MFILALFVVLFCNFQQRRTQTRASRATLDITVGLFHCYCASHEHSQNVTSGQIASNMQNSIRAFQNKTARQGMYYLPIMHQWGFVLNPDSNMSSLLFQLFHKFATHALQIKMSFYIWEKRTRARKWYTILYIVGNRSEPCVLISFPLTWRTWGALMVDQQSCPQSVRTLRCTWLSQHFYWNLEDCYAKFKRHHSLYIGL